MFGADVRARRLRLGLTQEELGDRTMLSVRALGKIESGETAAPRSRTVRLLADAFGLSGAEREGFLRAAVPVPDPAGNSRSVGRRVIPAQLPPDVRVFTGRRVELARLDESLVNRRSSGDTTDSAAVGIAVVSGTAGVGKTALAVHWAHRVRNRFPDGQLYVNLRGYDPDQPMAAADPLGGFLAAFGVPSEDIPGDVAERASRYRTELAGRRMLVLLDNASSVEQVRPLLPGTASCVVLVTSRDSLPGLVARDGAERVDLDLLPREDAHNLLRRLIGPRADAAPATVTVLAGLCARLPLALRVAAELAVARPAATLDSLAGELADQQRRLDLLDAGGDPRAGVSAVFSWSLRNLPPCPAQIFPLLGLQPGPTFARHAVAAMAGISPAEADTALTTLARAHLVQPVGSDRYGMHDLLRAYAVQLVGDDDRRVALSRLLDHYLHNAFAADRWLNSHRRPITLPPAHTGAVVPTIGSYADAIAWFRAEADNLAAATRFALDNGWLVHAWQLPWTTVNYLCLHGKWSEWIASHLDALEATRRLPDQGAAARILHSLARAYNEFGELDHAFTKYSEALDLYRAAGEVNGQANSLNGLSGNCLRLGRLNDALVYAKEAIRLYTGLADPTGQASTLNLLGRVLSALDHHRLAITAHRAALALFSDTKDIYGQANTWDALGDTLGKAGRTVHAAACHGRAVGLHEVLGNRFSLATSHQRLAESLSTLGNPGAAETHHNEALTIFRELNPRFSFIPQQGVLTHDRTARTSPRVCVIRAREQATQGERAHTGTRSSQEENGRLSRPLAHDNPTRLEPDDNQPDPGGGLRAGGGVGPLPGRGRGHMSRRDEPRRPTRADHHPRAAEQRPGDLGPQDHSDHSPRLGDRRRANGVAADDRQPLQDHRGQRAGH